MSEETQPTASKGTSVCAIIGLVLGVIALIFSWIPLVNMLSMVLALPGLVLGIIGIRGTRKAGKKTGRPVAIVGTVLCIVALFMSFGANKAASDALKKSQDEKAQSVAAASSNARSSTETKTENKTDNKSDAQASNSEKTVKYQVTEEAGAADSYSYKITGKLTNNSGKDTGYVQVNYNLYDAEGNQIGTALANTNNLKAGKTWAYEATSLIKDPSKVAKFELADITAW